MPAPLNPNLWPTVLHDEDGVPISPSNPLPVTSGGSGTSNVNIVGVTPGTTITTAPDTAVGAGATVPLPVIPAGTRRARVIVTGGDSTTEIRVREVGAAAGSGIPLNLGGSTMYGGADGALADLEVENVTGGAGAVAIQFEGN